MPFLPRRAVLLAPAGALLPRAVRAAPAPLPGTFALPNGAARVSATLAVSPARPGAGSRVLDIAMTPLGASRPTTRYDVELGKRMHVIAVSADFATFLHWHGDTPAPDGHFRVPVTLPHGGPWHVYADATPTGLPQQVMRFELDAGAPAPVPMPMPTGLEGHDGRYSVRFDALDLRAGKEAVLSLHLLRDGKPAPDLAPFLGVAAHAVFISATDLSYVHVHATPAAGTGTGMDHGTGHGTGHGAMGGMGHGGAHDMADMAPLAGGRLAPDLALHVLAPKAGTYGLWLQFTAGGRVRTVPFTVAVA